jgi:hypothetical protein
MPERQLRAGAAAAVITPELGVSLCGSLMDRRAASIHDDLHARCVVLDNGENRIALVVLDLLAARKEWLGEIKHQVHGQINLPLANILISCTHTLHAPSAVDLFQSNTDTGYLRWAATRVADVVRVAVGRLQPARVGWAVGREERVAFNRRYIMRDGTPMPTPFPGQRDQVLMNPAPGNPAIVRPAGPIDPDIAVLAAQRVGAGQPLAVYSSYALQQVGGNPPGDVSADYFGVVADLLHDRTGGPRWDARQPFVGMLAIGCGGDVCSTDARRPAPPPQPYSEIFATAATVASAIEGAWRTIRYHDWVSLRAAETTVELAVRRPTERELAEAREVLQHAPQGPLRGLREIYARETVQLAGFPARLATPVQALRIGDMAIVGLPGLPFCQIGMNIKTRSPLRPTMTVALANDHAGYLPTEDQHTLGGYECWRSRASFVEPRAATILQSAALRLLAQLAR